MNMVVIQDGEAALVGLSLETAGCSMPCAIASRLDGTTGQSNWRGRRVRGCASRPSSFTMEIPDAANGGSGRPCEGG